LLLLELLCRIPGFEENLFMPPIYDPEAVRPMWEELAEVGVTPLTTPEDVDNYIGEGKQGTTMVVINSVCGCAAGACRPGVMLALQHDKIPDNMVTVFAGVDTEAVQRVREKITESPPSSPNVLIYQDGRLVHALQRHNIERMSAVDIANNLRQVFDQICTRQGPSIPADEFERIDPVQQCGSSIPLYPGN
jgi:putative YphP/YqiW family bacilliredoxin